jgi:hypothetical protein
LGTALEQAVVGLGNPDFVADADLTITITNSNAAQAARALVLNVTSAFGSLTATRELVVPTSQKQYIVQNNTAGGQSITVKTSGGTGITVPNGRKAHLYVDGTNVVQMFDFVDINGGAIDGTTVGAAAASTGAFTNLSASGTLGVTGVATLGVGAVLNTPASVTLTNATGLPISTGVSGLGTGVATFLGTPSSANLAAAVTDETGTGALVFANSPTLVTPALGTPASGVVTNLTGTASININGTVGATTANTGAFTTLTTSSTVTHNGGTANGVAYLNGSKVLTTGSALTFDGTNFGVGTATPTLTSGATGIDIYDNSDAQIRLHNSTTGTGVSDGLLISLASDNAGYFYNYENAPLIFGTNNAEQMRLTSTGLGIGTSSPSVSLDVAGGDFRINRGATNSVVTATLETNMSGSSSKNIINFRNAALSGNPMAAIEQFDDGTNVNGSLLFKTNGGGTNSERMRIDSAGNVGIGTSSPGAKLDVNGSPAGSLARFLNTTAPTLSNDTHAGEALFLRSGGTAGSGNVQAVLAFGKADGASVRSGSAIASVQTTADADQVGIGFYTSVSSASSQTLTQAMLIDASGNVGIGTSSPLFKQHTVVAGATGDIAGFGLSGNANNPVLLIKADATNQVITLRGGSSSGTYPAIAFDTGTGAERMRITSAGNVGIGTSAPAYKLDIRSAQDDATNFLLNGLNIVNTSNQSAVANKTAIRLGVLQDGGVRAAKIVAEAEGGSSTNNIALSFRTNTADAEDSTTEAMRITSAGDVGIGTSSPTNVSNYKAITVNGTTGSFIDFQSNGTTGGRIQTDTTYPGMALFAVTNQPMVFGTNGTERVRITSDGAFLVGANSIPASSNALTGTAIYGAASPGQIETAGNGVLLVCNRQTTDGTLILFRQDGIDEGSISVSGSTVSYLGGHLSRWAQMLTKPDLLKGTVMSNLDEMNVYIKPTLYWTEEDKLPVDEEGNPTVAVGDVKEETSVSENEQLNKVKVSDVEGDPNVAGVFVNWTYDEAHEVDEINMAMTGDMIIRIAQGVTVQRGDLLMSAGDGTAKPQGDDIVRSKTIAKVTSTHVTCTYADGSFCVPCVLMAC